jgi:hypothetical protein
MPDRLKNKHHKQKGRPRSLVLCACNIFLTVFKVKFLIYQGKHGVFSEIFLKFSVKRGKGLNYEQ